MNDKKIAEIKLTELLEMPLCIPPYQRPYSWSLEHVDQLLTSLSEAADLENSLPLVMGTIILHQDCPTSWNIVDGQQRMVTFWLIVNTVRPDYSQVCLRESTFVHVESQRNIWLNHELITKWWRKKKPTVKSKIAGLLGSDRIQFVRVRADTLDEAFVFFDSQNSRGKALEEYDLIKANHLRYIKESTLQKQCAMSWEKIEQDGNNGENGRKDTGRCLPSMKYLMTGLIGKPRQFALQRQLTLREEFKCQRVTPQVTGACTYYPLSNYNQPPIFTQWRFDHTAEEPHCGGLELILKAIDADTGTRRFRFESDSKRFMPFQLTQALEGGEQFFWFVEKYHKLYQELFIKPSNLQIPLTFRRLMGVIRGCRSTDYVRKCFEAAMLFYYDKFGADDQLDFLKSALYLEHAIFHLQVKQVVQERSVPKFIRECFNPFKLIQESSSPIHIIVFIRQNMGNWYDKRPEKAPACEYLASIKEFLVGLASDADGLCQLQSSAAELIEEKQINLTDVTK